MSLDPRFLTLHPATALWFEQRKKCERCAHADIRTLRGSEVVMRCKVTPMTTDPVQMGGYRKRNLMGAYCIDARLPENPCGPDARLYSPKGKAK